MTASSVEEAEKISNALLVKRLVACTNLVKDIKSNYWWNSKIEHESEVLIISKSTEDKLASIISEVKKLHSYDVPEIIAIPIVGGNKEYLDWIEKETSTK